MPRSRLNYEISTGARKGSIIEEDSGGPTPVEYREDSVIGEGIYGRVRKFKSEKTAKYYAVKDFKETGTLEEIKSEASCFKRAYQQYESEIFLEESSLVQKCRFIMPYFDGVSFDEAMKAYPLYQNEIIFAVILELVRIHSCKVIHGDIWSRNIRIQRIESGFPKMGNSIGRSQLEKHLAEEGVLEEYLAKECFTFTVKFIDFGHSYLSGGFAKMKPTNLRSSSFAPERVIKPYQVDRWRKRGSKAVPANVNQDVYSLGYMIGLFYQKYGEIPGLVSGFQEKALNLIPSYRPSLLSLIEDYKEYSFYRKYEGIIDAYSLSVNFSKRASTRSHYNCLPTHLSAAAQLVTKSERRALQAPAHIHYIWVGGKITANNMRTALLTAKKQEKMHFFLWTDSKAKFEMSTRYIKGHSLSYAANLKNFHLRDIGDLVAWVESNYKKIFHPNNPFFYTFSLFDLQCMSNRRGAGRDTNTRALKYISSLWQPESVVSARSENPLKATLPDMMLQLFYHYLNLMGFTYKASDSGYGRTPDYHTTPELESKINYNNYASVSDLLRIICILKEGGLYIDFDETVDKFLLEPEDFSLNERFRYGVGYHNNNAVQLSMPLNLSSPHLNGEQEIWQNHLGQNLLILMLSKLAHYNQPLRELLKANYPLCDVLKHESADELMGFNSAYDYMRKPLAEAQGRKAKTQSSSGAQGPYQRSYRGNRDDSFSLFEAARWLKQPIEVNYLSALEASKRDKLNSFIQDFEKGGLSREDIESRFDLEKQEELDEDRQGREKFEPFFISNRLKKKISGGFSGSWRNGQKEKPITFQGQSSRAEPRHFLSDSTHRKLISKQVSGIKEQVDHNKGSARAQFAIGLGPGCIDHLLCLSSYGLFTKCRYEISVRNMKGRMAADPWQELTQALPRRKGLSLGLPPQFLDSSDDESISEELRMIGRSQQFKPAHPHRRGKMPIRTDLWDSCSDDDCEPMPIPPAPEEFSRRPHQQQIVGARPAYRGRRDKMPRGVSLSDSFDDGVYALEHSNSEEFPKRPQPQLKPTHPHGGGKPKRMSLSDSFDDGLLGLESSNSEELPKRSQPQLKPTHPHEKGKSRRMNSWDSCSGDEHEPIPPAPEEFSRRPHQQQIVGARPAYRGRRDRMPRRVSLSDSFDDGLLGLESSSSEELPKRSQQQFKPTLPHKPKRINLRRSGHSDGYGNRWAKFRKDKLYKRAYEFGCMIGALQSAASSYLIPEDGKPGNTGKKRTKQYQQHLLHCKEQLLKLRGDTKRTDEEVSKFLEALEKESVRHLVLMVKNEEPYRYFLSPGGTNNSSLFSYILDYLFYFYKYKGNPLACNFYPAAYYYEGNKEPRASKLESKVLQHFLRKVFLDYTGDPDYGSREYAKKHIDPYTEQINSDKNFRKVLIERIKSTRVKRAKPRKPNEFIGIGGRKICQSEKR
ncbi:protein kinase domain-containing protein [Piscirickettsia litoralis]|uniref:Protein kinase domain-containing protein n=1 Tax=Piscirickettsia litoralis TaxID=1891921 RepID=A0ABX3A183_9GAMM|nr:glycosyltransferase [Piscirickettsia litoralis]ODN42583.1 hypothetical protein BGC07_06100 [Piscirickettsia litoralis]